MLQFMKRNAAGVTLPGEDYATFYIDQQGRPAYLDHLGNQVLIGAGGYQVSFDMASTDAESAAYSLPDNKRKQVITFELAGAAGVAKGAKIDIWVSPNGSSWITPSSNGGDLTLSKSVATFSTSQTNSVTLQSYWKYVKFVLSNKVGTFTLKVTVA